MSAQPTILVHVLFFFSPPPFPPFSLSHITMKTDGWMDGWMDGSASAHRSRRAFRNSLFSFPFLFLPLAIHSMLSGDQHRAWPSNPSSQPLSPRICNQLASLHIQQSPTHHQRERERGGWHRAITATPTLCIQLERMLGAELDAPDIGRC